MVQGDGELEPELPIDPAAAPAIHTEAPPSVESLEQDLEPARGGAMRARLLERAARAPQQSRAQELSEAGDDLDEIG